MAVIRPGEDGYYIAECAGHPVATQGKSLDETLGNLREAVELYLEGEDLAELGLAKDPSVIVSMELEIAVA